MAADLPVRRAPTHVLTVEVPLYLQDLDAARFDPVQDAMRVVLALSRAAAEGYVCDDVQVTLVEEVAPRQVLGVARGMDGAPGRGEQMPGSGLPPVAEEVEPTFGNQKGPAPA